MVRFKSIESFMSKTVTSTYKGTKTTIPSREFSGKLKVTARNQAFRKGQVGVDVYEYLIDADTGKLVLGTTRYKGFVPYMNQGMSKLDNGFSTLVNRFRLSGMPEYVINRLTRKWEMLPDSAKGRVFNSYRSNTFEAGYGSDAYDERAVMSFEDDSVYAEILENCIDDELGVPLSERNYEYN